MSKRLQVILDDAEIVELREAAHARGETVSQWVRDAVREARARQPTGDLETKLRAVRAAAKHDFPTGEIDEMLEDIKRGRATGSP